MDGPEIRAESKQTDGDLTPLSHNEGPQRQRLAEQDIGSKKIQSVLDMLDLNGDGQRLEPMA